jgi:hypothetical protein
MITRVAIESDIDGILELQSRNLYTNLSEAERTEGFVTTPFSVQKNREAWLGMPLPGTGISSHGGLFFHT